MTRNLLAHPTCKACGRAASGACRFHEKLNGASGELVTLDASPGGKRRQRASNVRERRDVYERVTDLIIAQLEAGTVPWSRSWSSEAAGALGGLHRNLLSGRPYAGVNQIVAWATAYDRGYTANAWVTYAQARKLGGSVRAGEQGTPIMFWKFPKPDESDESDESDDATRRRRPFAVAHTVFNVAQCTGLPDAVDLYGEAPEFVPVERAQRVVDSMRAAPVIRHGGPDAWYSVQRDLVQMPDPRAFETPDAYYHTLFHELAHSTRHSSRLDRRFRGEQEPDSPRRFGSADYSREELVAELAAVMVCAACAIDADIPRSAAYVDNWLRMLRDDRRMLVFAASKAQHAADWILGGRADAADDMPAVDDSIMAPDAPTMVH